MQDKSIILLCVVLGLLSVVIMALVTRFFVQKHAKHDAQDPAGAYTVDGCIEAPKHIRNISNSWKRLLGPKQEQPITHTVQSLASIIQAGDEGAFSCNIFHDIQGHAHENSLDSFYRAFATGSWRRSIGDRPVLISPMKRTGNGLGRSKSERNHRNTRMKSSATSNKRSLDISLAEKGLTRSLSPKKATPVLISMRNGMEDDTRVKPPPRRRSRDKNSGRINDEQMRDGISQSELAALAIISGQESLSSDKRKVGAEDSLDSSAYGISIVPLFSEDNKIRISLRRSKLSIFQYHAPGATISPLFAKHLAASSLPYRQHGGTVESILIDNSTLLHIRSSTSLALKPCFTLPYSAEYLNLLPNAYTHTFHILTLSSTLDFTSASTLTNAIAALPFSSALPPLASTPLIRTINFIASGGLPAGHLLQRLEGLVDKIHRSNPALSLFGPLYESQHARLLYRERERLGRLATRPGQMRDTLADKAARMARYVVMLRRLMALAVGPELRAEEVREKVEEGVRREMHQAYVAAVASHNSTTAAATNTPSDKNNCSTTSITHPYHSPLPASLTSAPSKRPSSPPPPSTHPSVHTTTTTTTSSRGRRRSTEHENTLARRMEDVLKLELPFHVDIVAFVARMVVVAWTMSVGGVKWKEGDDGVELISLEVRDGVGGEREIRNR